MLEAIEFFAGSGLVRLGLQPYFASVWANDNSPKKQAVYVDNHGASCFTPEDVRLIHGQSIPRADLAWASFPCQDLSLAGALGGMSSETRSGLFWEWIRVLWELRAANKLPGVLAAENVIGFLIADGGSHFQKACHALGELGYRCGALAVNASSFLPQSRPRAFLIAVRDGVDLTGISQARPSAPFHSAAVVKAAKLVSPATWVWWTLPLPPARQTNLDDILELDAPCHDDKQSAALLNLLSPLHRVKLDKARALGITFRATAYRRTRPDEDERKVQRLEVRFDGVAGCLRTPNGGSSRQTVLLVDERGARTRLLTARECARLMGAPDTFRLPSTYNDAYRAMGDAVAVPVTDWLARHLLAPLASRVKGLSPAPPQPDSTWSQLPLETANLSREHHA